MIIKYLSFWVSVIGGNGFFSSVTCKEFQEHSCRVSFSVKSCSTLSQRLREWAGYVDSGEEVRGKRTLPCCCCSLLPWLQVSGESFEFRGKEGNKYLWESGRNMGVLQGGSWWLFCLASSYALRFGEEQASFRRPSLFLIFPWPVPSTYQRSFLDSQRPSPNLIISLEFPRLVSFTLNGSHLGSYCPSS